MWRNLTLVRNAEHRADSAAERIRDLRQFASGVATEIARFGTEVRLVNFTDRPPATEAIVQPPGFIRE